ncbi:unnamed protein product [Hymenolepis diminuta]|uniref:26S proteasome non-ATPase regulatory subunit 14 n=2 Tax=Hymenolepis diminuta TaxID=6216 RepID=A0A0R3SCH5_HYMDI|nr:unnamed protein product [Hymenolepis diminuta]
MERLLRFGAENFISQGNSQPTDGPVPDTAEQVYISSLALLKMLKHGRAGVPMEVMGLMLGEFVDDYTVTVVDVFAMPQSGTGVSVEAVDPVFQAKMIDMLKQTGRPEMVVGWYHSHPGFGCWLSGVDMNTQQSFEALSDRAVAVVVDPIQSVKGKVVIDAFRLINPNMVIANQEPRQTTSNLGHLNKPSIQALIHGLNRHYYSLPINYRKNKREQTMLMNLDKRTWQEGLTLEDYPTHCNANHKTLQHVLDLVKTYNKSLEEEEKMTPEQLAIKNVGKMDPKRHLEENVDELVWNNITQGLAMGPEKPISSEEARARAERNRQEALLRLQRNQSLKNRSVSSQLSNTIRPNLTTQSSLMNVSQVKANLPRTISASTSANSSKFVRAPIVPKSNEASAYLKRPAPSGSSDYPKGAKVLSFGAKTPSVRAVCVLISRTEFEVQARYHAGLIAVCKSLPTRVYDENTKKWHFNLSDYREFLKRSSGLEGIQLEGLSSAVVTAFKSQMEGDESSTEREMDVDLNDKIPRSLNDSLLGFQREGVKFALKHDGRVLLADDMGLGKTLQSLAIAAAYRSEWPLLIVTQLSLRCAWREAVLTWLGPCLNLTSSDIYIVESLNDALNSIQYVWSRKPITIFTYDLLSRYVEKSGPSTLTNFKVVIMDESHNLKNMKASRTQAALPVLKAAKRAVLLTGTPALSRPMELYSQLVGLRPNLFRGGLHEFGLRYCDAKETAWGWDYKGCSNLQELQLLLQETVMIRCEQ